jgi:excinuclease ABC subunit C
MLESLLDEIDDLGPTRRAALLDRYGSVAAIKKATAEDIALTPGIGERLATAIANHLNNQNETAVEIDMETGEVKDA